ncbi:MAG: DNA topoisomerase I [Candidatus Pacearchaeota archaeon]
MPKRPQKPRELKIAEEFFPADPGNIKYSVEKKFSPLSPLINIEAKKPRKKTLKTKRAIKKKTARKTKKTTRKKATKKRATKRATEFKIPKIKLKKDGYELIVTEKPQAAVKIANALGKSTKRVINGVSYYEIDRPGKQEGIIVACAVGHLFTLKQEKPRVSGPVFDLLWVPNHYVRKNDFSKKYLDVMTKLARNAGAVTIATDYDIEGEVIGLNIIRFAAGQKDANRMKFSTLTEKELNDSYESKLKSIDWGQAIAGETRHFLDWFYGINLSRALMKSLKSVGKFKLMSIGRVQGPALNLIVKKEKEVQKFKPKPYWQIFITLEEPEIELIHNKDIFDKSELKKFENLIGKTGQAETKKKEKEIPPKIPFNLTTLQTESYRLFGINPSKTLQLAQSLYLNGLISYPRTSSQKLPPSINYRSILSKIAKSYRAEKFIKREKPVEGEKSDPAHPSIYPTGETENLQSLSDDEKKIYDLVARRFLCLFMENAVIEDKKITVKVDDLGFYKKGSEIKNKSWLQFYPQKVKEEEIPDVNGEVKVKDSRNEEKETQPPKRFTPASLVSELEKRNLGTKATRSNILETLYNRGYIKDQSIKPTPLGMSLIDTLEKHSPIIIDEKLTREFENQMESIRESGKNSDEKKNNVISKAKETITEISNQFDKKQETIGEEISKANDKLREQQKEENKLNICPVCKKGSLGIMYSKKTRRYFVACDAYPDCKNTYSLPPNGLIKKTDKICEECGFPKVMRLSKGRRPWEFCFNRDCPTNKKRIEEYNRRKAEEVEE